MGSHLDRDHGKREEFLKEMRLRSEIMTDLSKNTIQNEKPLLAWEAGGIRCQLLPNDRQDVIRVSIGGGDDLPVHADYCNIRGDVSKVISLLSRALAAVQKCPE